MPKSAYVKLACGHSISRDRMFAVSLLGDRLHATVQCPKCLQYMPIPKDKKRKPAVTPEEPMF